MSSVFLCKLLRSLLLLGYNLSTFSHQSSYRSGTCTISTSSLIHLSNHGSVASPSLHPRRAGLPSCFLISSPVTSHKSSLPWLFCPVCQNSYPLPDTLLQFNVDCFLYFFSLTDSFPSVELSWSVPKVVSQTSSLSTLSLFLLIFP